MVLAIAISDVLGAGKGGDSFGLLQALREARVNQTYNYWFDLLSTEV